MTTGNESLGKKSGIILKPLRFTTPYSTVLEKHTGPERIPYVTLLDTREWGMKRDIIIKRDGGVCTRCKGERKNEKGGIFSLEVHHTYYVKNTLPWNYDDESLITLCTYCHTEAHNLGKILTYDVKPFYKSEPVIQEPIPVKVRDYYQESQNDEASKIVVYFCLAIFVIILVVGMVESCSSGRYKSQSVVDSTQRVDSSANKVDVGKFSEKFLGYSSYNEDFQFTQPFHKVECEFFFSKTHVKYIEGGKIKKFKIIRHLNLSPTQIYYLRDGNRNIMLYRGDKMVTLDRGVGKIKLFVLPKE